MAIGCIKSISSSATSWNLHSLAVPHCSGPVHVGETSVFVAISSVHRSDALDACKFVIDEIKATVPIWKKEVYANGEVWKENSEFLERKLDLVYHGENNVGGGCGRNLEVNSHDRKGCCGVKVRVDTEETDNTNNEADNV